MNTCIVCGCELREEDVQCPNCNKARSVLALPSYDADLGKLLANIDKPDYYCTLKAETKQEALKLHNYRSCWTNGIPRLRSDDGITVCGFMVYYTEYDNREGERVCGPTMILIDEQDRGYRIGSKLLIKQILEFCSSWEPLSKENPVKMRCTDLVLDNGNRTYQLVLG